jgi:regulator of protease activity HflC (stomatin/prohibitin superfamily)
METMGILGICLAIVAIVVIIILANAIKIVREYERVVIFRLGRLLGKPKGPGILFIIPLVDQMVRIDLRTMVIDVTKQRVVTKDNVTVDVDAVVYYRVFDPQKAVVQVQQYIYATTLLAQTTLRDILGQVELDDLLSKREELNKKLQLVLDTATDPWGIKVSAVTIKDVALPETMLRAIAKQAEAERERRSRVIMAEGELQAAQKMKEAAEQYERAPISLRLRELQTLTEIAREKNLIVVPGGEIGTIAGIAKAVQKATKE